MSTDYRGKAVLVTGGTKGIGLACGLAYARQGAACTLTNRWGSADEDAIREQFRDVGGPEPHIVEADAGSPEDTVDLVHGLRERHDTLDVFVSNVSFAQIVKGMQDYSKRALVRSIEYTVWPTFEYLDRIREAFGRYPRYVIGLSSIGPDAFVANYDFVAGSKALLETLMRYLNYRLRGEGVRVNVVRAALVRTDSLRATMGEDCVPFIERFDPRMFVTPEAVADTVFALTSGLMDGISGQVLTVDNGVAFYDNVMRLFGERDRLEIPPKEKQQ
ncbi:MAG: SDR family oxidoreductase [Polyangiaceae bacterium]|nr:SDR family oxidoreductase [Polyangiaceae bacterium]